MVVTPGRHSLRSQEESLGATRDWASLLPEIQREVPETTETEMRALLALKREDIATKDA